MLSKLSHYLGEYSERFRSLLQGQPTNHVPGFCCLSMDSHFIYLAYAANKELKFIETKSYQKGENIAALLKAMVKKHDLSGAKCSWVLQPGYYQLLLMDALPVPESEFQSAIRWKAKGLLQFPPEDAVFDSFPMPPQKTHSINKMITVVVSRLSYLKPIVEKINDSDLQLMTIDVADLALRNITSLYENDEKTSALIYVEDKACQIIITRQKHLYFQRHFDFGLDQAHPNLDASDPQLQKIALELQRSFDYYQSQWREPPPSRVFLASTKLSAVAIAAHFANELALPIQALDLREVLNSKVDIPIEMQGRCLTVIGGLLREESIEHAPAS